MRSFSVGGLKPQSAVLLYDVPVYSREGVTFKANGSAARVIEIGTVLGKVVTAAFAAQSAAKAGGNTGNGTFVLDGSTPVLAAAMQGKYTLTCTVAGTNSGTFRLEDPKGRVLGDFEFSGSNGNSITIAEHIKGVLTDGGTDFVKGDAFVITVSKTGAGVEKYVEFNPVGTDGSEEIAGVAIDRVHVGEDTDADGTIAARHTALKADGLVWPAEITAAEKATALEALAALGIVAR